MTDPTTTVEELESRLGANWSNLRTARSGSAEKIAELRDAVAGLDSEDTSVVLTK